MNGDKCPFLLTCACTTLHLACAVAMSWHHGRHWTDYRATLDASSHAQLLLSGSELIISLSAACWCSPFVKHQQQSHSKKQQLGWHFLCWVLQLMQCSVSDSFHVRATVFLSLFFFFPRSFFQIKFSEL